MIRLTRILLIIILFTAGCSRSAPVTIRILSYNIHHAEGTDNRLDLDRIARIVRDSGADLVALQEVDRNVKRSANVDQPARLGELTAMRSLFEKNIDLQGGQYGNAILTRLPVESYRHEFLPRRGNNEQRGLLEARLRIAGSPLIFLATHLDHQRDDAERMDSAAAIRRLIDDRPGLPVILAGDLNATPDSTVLAELRSFLFDTCPPGLTDALTIPAGQPRHRIDYILYNRDPRLRPIDYRVLPEPVASDHRPVLATFLVEREPAKLPTRMREALLGRPMPEPPVQGANQVPLVRESLLAPSASGNPFPRDEPSSKPPATAPDPRLTIDRIAPAKGSAFPPNLQRIDYTSTAGHLKDWALVLPSDKPAWIVMIHGHGSTGDQLFTRPDMRQAWLPVFQANYGILTVNLRGNAWMSPDAAADLHALLAEVRTRYHPRRFLFVSGSMGGTSNLIYAVLHPEDVSGVVALCPAADLATYYHWCIDHKDVPVLTQISEAIDAAYTGPPGQRPELYRDHSAVLRADRLTMPTYVVHGSADAVIPVTQSRALAKAIGDRPTFHYHEIENGDHEVPLRHMQEALTWVLGRMK